MKKNFYTYEESKSLLKPINIKTKTDWSNYLKSNLRSYNIPSNPNTYYLNKGWISWEDFFGVSELDRVKKYFIPYEEAHKIVLGLKINSRRKYEREYSNLIQEYNIPTKPDVIYKNTGWVSWEDFLGVEIKKCRNSRGVNFLSYDEAKNKIKYLKIETHREWENIISKNETLYDIPHDPHRYYKNKGWKDWFDFLGKEKENKVYYTYEECLKYLRVNNITSKTKYSKMKNNNMPNEPNIFYRNKGWVSWDQFFGIDGYESNIYKPNFYSYEEAKNAVKNLGIKSAGQWENKYIKSVEFDSRLPKNPKESYKNKGWISWSDFLSFDIEGYWKKVHYSYEEAKKIVHTYGFYSKNEWENNYSQTDIRFDKLPSKPDVTYKNAGWVSWEDFLGENYGKARFNFLSFDEARTYMRNMGLKSKYEWDQLKLKKLKPDFIPGNPETYYKGEFKGYMDFLGYEYHNPKKSLAEHIIIEFLDKHNIRFEDEKTFKSCIHINQLPFDFYLPDYNMLIEYDGEQHFKPITLFGGEEIFENIKMKDKIKSDWAINNNYNLIRIPYTKMNYIETILSEALEL